MSEALTPEVVDRAPGEALPAVVPVSRLDELRAMSEEMSRLVTETVRTAAAAVPPNTRRTYESNWRQWERWCAGHGLPSLPAHAEDVCCYLVDRASDLTIATLRGHLSAIADRHTRAKARNPVNSEEVRTTWQGLRSLNLVDPVQKRPVRFVDVQRMVDRLELDTLLGLRDRALLLVGWAGAFRRSEVVSLDVADLDLEPAGIKARLHKSKTNRTGPSEKIGLPMGPEPRYCPPTAVAEWLTAAGVTEGPVFRRVYRGGHVGTDRLTPRSVALVVKRSVERLGLDPAGYGGHSLRAGLITTAHEAGADEARSMRQSRHRSPAVHRGYARDLDLLDHQNAARVAMFGQRTGA